MIIIIITIIVNKRDRSCPEDGRVTEKKGEKGEKYQDIARGSKNVGCKNKGDSGGNWGIRISTNEFKNNLKVIDVDVSMEVTQKC